jgi:hypothetical protein
MVSYKDYRKIRTEHGVPAYIAVAWARQGDPADRYPEMDWELGVGTVDGHEVTVRMTLDDEYEPVGAFTDKPSETAIPNPDWRPGMTGTYRYYEPYNAISEARESLSRLGHARHEAWCIAMASARADARQDAIGEWWTVEVIADDGRSASLSAISSPDHEYLEVVAGDLIDELFD